MKNLKVTVNGVAYNVQVEEVGGAAPVAAAPCGSSGSLRRLRLPQQLRLRRQLPLPQRLPLALKP